MSKMSELHAEQENLIGVERVWDAQLGTCELDMGLREVRGWMEYTLPVPYANWVEAIEHFHLEFIHVWMESEYGDDATYAALN